MPEVLPQISPHDFVLKSDGNKDWGWITPEIEAATGGELVSGPIRVCHGFDGGHSRGYGKIHIEAEYYKEFISCGFESFVLSAIGSIDAIYIQENKRVIVFRKDRFRMVAVLEARSRPDFHYSVVTVYRTNPQRRIRGELIWERG